MVLFQKFISFTTFVMNIENIKSFHVVVVVSSINKYFKMSSTKHT